MVPDPRRIRPAVPSQVRSPITRAGWWSLLACAVMLQVLPQGAAAAASSSPTPDRVLVVYDSAWPYDSLGVGESDSQQVAEYYAARRGVPAANLLGLSCSTGSLYYYFTGQWPAFEAEVIAPIQTKLAQLGPNAIDVIVLCFGIPYTVTTASGTICVDNVLMGLNAWSADGSNVAWSTNPYFDTAPGFDASPGHFDHSLYAFNGTPMYLVSRLDGPGGAPGAMELVDQALYGDTYLTTAAGGYQGNIYIDSRYGEDGSATPYTDAFLASDANVQTGAYYGYDTADECIAWGEHAGVASGLPTFWENTTDAIQIGQSGATYSDGSSALTAPNAILYGGWYNIGGYHDVYGWLPGAVACDLNSLSCASPRDPTSTAFGPSALARGASCTCGVLNEPYLTGHQRPNILLYYMLQGYSFAEAATLATPAIAWQDIAIGDPLYAPFRSHPAQFDTVPPALDAGFPQIVVGAVPTDRVISLMIAQPQPEVAQAAVDVGPTAAYGTTLTSGEGYWRRPSVTLPGLTAGATYHYRVRLTDPVGNQSQSADATFSIPLAASAGPTLVTVAQAAPTTVTDGTCAVSVLGTVVAGAAPLSYHWSVLGWGPAPIAVSPNDSPAASQATVTFAAVGTYRLRGTMIDADGLSVTSDVTVTVTGLGSATGSGTSATSTGTGTGTTATATTGTGTTATGTTTGTGPTGTTGTGATTAATTAGTATTTGTGTGSDTAGSGSSASAGSSGSTASGASTSAATATAGTGGASGSGGGGGACGLGTGISVILMVIVARVRHRRVAETVGMTASYRLAGNSGSS